MTTKELLKQWAQLEPERCEKHQIDDKLYFAISDLVFQPDLTPFSVLVRGHRFEEKEAKMWLQFAIQQAIEARGWGYELYQYEQCSAIITVTVFGAKRYSSSPLVDAPAEALLSAYLRAVERHQ